MCACVKTDGFCWRAEGPAGWNDHQDTLEGVDTQRDGHVKAGSLECGCH